MKANQQVDIARIRIDGGTQIRESLYDPATLVEYAEASAGGAVFPPIHVVDDGSDLWLVDGFHRHAVALKEKKKTISATVREGTRADAQWLACAANRGLARTQADKRAAVKAALAHPKSAGLTDRAVASHCGVGDQLVAAVRNENRPVAQVRESRTSDIPDSAPTHAAKPGKKPREVSPDIPSEPKRKGLDGKSYPAAAARSPVAAARKEVAPELLDAMGREVPASLAPLWRALLDVYEGTSSAVDALRAASTAQRAAVTRLAKGREGAVMLHATVQAWAVGQACSAARHGADETKPHIVCPECDGTGGSAPTWCTHCGACGWLTASALERRVRGAKARR